MLKVNLKLTILMVLAISIFFASAAWAEDNEFYGNLTCSMIGPKHPEHTDATGEVFFKLDESTHELSYRLQVKNIKDLYMAHLHMGPCSSGNKVEQGPIAAWLYPCGDHRAPDRCIEGEFSGVLAEGVIRQEDLEHNIQFEDLIEAMRNGSTYVNVHTRTYVTGEICGIIKSQN